MSETDILKFEGVADKQAVNTALNVKAQKWQELLAKRILPVLVPKSWVMSCIQCCSALFWMSMVRICRFWFIRMTVCILLLRFYWRRRL